MLSVIELIASIGGIGAVFALLMFYVNKETQRQMRDDRKFMEDRLSDIIAKDQTSRETQTKVLTELVILIQRLNGKT